MSFIKDAPNFISLIHASFIVFQVTINNLLFFSKHKHHSNSKQWAATLPRASLRPARKEVPSCAVTTSRAPMISLACQSSLRAPNPLSPETSPRPSGTSIRTRVTKQAFLSRLASSLVARILTQASAATPAPRTPTLPSRTSSTRSSRSITVTAPPTLTSLTWTPHSSTAHPSLRTRPPSSSLPVSVSDVT